MVKFNLKELLAQKEFKEGKAVSIVDVSQILDISKNTLYRIANSKGSCNTTTDNIEKLCRYFNCSPNDLMTIVPDPGVGNEAEGMEKERNTSCRESA